VIWSTFSDAICTIVNIANIWYHISARLRREVG